MLRQRRLAQPDQPLQLADGFLALREMAQDEQPALIRHRLEQGARLACISLEFVAIHARILESAPRPVKSARDLKNQVLRTKMRHSPATAAMSRSQLRPPVPIAA